MRNTLVILLLVTLLSVLKSKAQDYTPQKSFDKISFGLGIGLDNGRLERVSWFIHKEILGYLSPGDMP